MLYPPKAFVADAYNTGVKIGIIGLGFMGAVHLSAYAKVTGASVAAVCAGGSKDFTGDLSQVGGNLAREPVKFDFSSVRKYTSWKELVADPDIDAVDICLPTDLHAEVTVAALGNGKHVLCEKPMALTVQECERMMAAAAQAERILMVGQVLRFWPEYEELERIIQSGEYGSVRSATFVRRSGLPDWSRWLTDESRSGGAVLDLLLHDVDQVVLLFGMPQRVAAKSMGSPDTIMATLIYPGGPEVRIQGGWFATGTPFSMSFQVRTDRAELEWRPDGLFLSDSAGQRRKIPVSGTDAYESELAYFVRCCHNREQPSRCMPSESAQAVKLALLLKQSRAKGGEQLECKV
jgi:predicted dehydrogenase